MGVGQLGTRGRIVTLRATLDGGFVSVTAIILDLRTAARIVDKTTVNIRLAPSTALVHVHLLAVVIEPFLVRRFRV